MTRIGRGRAAAAATVTLLALGAAGAPARADAACILSVTYNGAPYIGAGELGPGDVGGRVGRAAVPPCNDVVVIPAPPPAPAPEPTPVTVSRVDGVAPRYAVAYTSGGPPQLMIVGGLACRRRTVQATLACLRASTRALKEGPALIAPTSAFPGAAVRIAVRAPRGSNAVIGVETLLQRRGLVGWQPTFHLFYAVPASASLPDPVPAGTPGVAVPAIGLRPGPGRFVKLPDVTSGSYRLVTTLGPGIRLTAPLTILPSLGSIPPPNA